MPGSTDDGLREGDYTTTFARFAVAVGFDDTVVHVFQLRDGKLARVWQFVPGLTPPLDNALPGSHRLVRLARTAVTTTAVRPGR